MKWPARVERELDDARAARERGNEGRARVCARRAAGIAVRAYFDRTGAHLSHTSAIDLLRAFEAEPGLDADLRQAVQHLTVRVDEQFTLPAGVDLIWEAKRVCDMIFR
jgi:hypothetical protein